ncbi:unnamed protein product [Brassica napus]|uniref:(rape) hypothetical protein n=1 Tax=Brassica napus TaxID=3708 RepID=A0A816VZ59_BRANA|nr:unnamed protein product [Brassica napus]
MKKSANSHLQKPRITESHHPTFQTSATGLHELQTTSRWLHQNGTEVKHSLETQIPISSTFITIGIQRSQCRPNSSQNNTDDHSQNQVQFRLPRLLSFCQLLRWELLVGVECIFHIIGIAHDKSSWLLDDVLQSFMKAHGPLKISTIGNWSVLLQCQMTFCAAIVPNTKRISVKLSKANTIQLFFFVCVLYIKRTRFSGEIELRYSSAKP